MSALRNQLRGRDAAYLMALLKNGDSDGPLVRAAYAELSGRGSLPEYAEGMFDVTSPGPGDVPDPLESSATPIIPDPMVEDLPIYGRKVVGPRTPLGGDPVPGAPMHSQEEVDDYYKRGIDPKTGDMIPSGADQGMLERGFRVVMGADGRPTYMMASDTTGMSQGLTGSAPIQAAEQRRLVTGNEGEKPAYWESGTRRGLDGGSVDVLVPTQANREYNAALQNRLAADRVSQRTGVSAEQLLDPEVRFTANRDARNADLAARRAKVKRDAMYAGGSHNINAANRNDNAYMAELAERDPAKHDAIKEQRSQPWGGMDVEYSQDPRTGRVTYKQTAPQANTAVQVAEIQAGASRDNATAEREARIAAQELARLDAEKNREFDAEQRQLDRDARMAEGNAAREAATVQRQEELDLRRQQHEENMLRIQQQDAAAQRRHEEALAANAEQAAARQQQFEARFGLDKGKMDADRAAQEQAMERAERERKLGTLESLYGPGVRNIADGDYESPSAQTALETMAAKSDQSWTGFYNADATRMDAILERIGVNDPATRRTLVNKFGLSAMPFSGPGGRSGPISGLVNWFSGAY